MSAPESPRTASPATAGAVAELRSVTKWYGPVIGVNDLDLTIGPGITGLLGPNGAGKTTLIKLLAGLLHPSLGKVTVSGRSAASSAAKEHIGYCPDVDAFYEEMSGRRFVRTMARLHGMSKSEAKERAEIALAEVGMTDRADRRLRGYSKGMRQRIKLAQALVHDPAMLIVDEPLNGVDPVGRRELMELFRGFRDRGKAVLVSSHILHEMDALAERVIFMGRGRILASGTLAEIREMLDEHPLHVRLRSSQARELAAQLIRWEDVKGIELRDEEEFSLEVRRPDAFFQRLGDFVVAESIDVSALETTDASAEAVFDYIMSSAARA
ncbi:MAG: ABC transporter ATP-binding protein [Planctomycetota bacterium]|nr:MAG: ABC transporter ATP-binding protein [Planctomycetota bacterium]REK20845.1 MAG: ABC transporter ATP-binding protein [Planctomycetota bacterium]REK36073.1 MAG: ABC transporter ATP-binding protein [Planctomycetota bacterium]